MCIYSLERAFIAYVIQLIRNCHCIKPQEFNLEDMNAQIRQCFGTVGWFIQLLGACFRQVIIPLFVIWQ